MKIVYITNTPSPFQIKWCDFLQEHLDIEFWFLTEFSDKAHGKPDYWKIKLAPGCRKISLKYKLNGLSYSSILKEELDKTNPDVIMLGGSWYARYFYSGYRWAVKNNKKILVGPVEFSKNLFKLRVIIRNLIVYRLVYKKVDLWMANSFIHFDYLTMLLRVKSRIFMNYDNYSPYIALPLKRDKKKIVFMFGGAIEKRNRVLEIIKAFERLVLVYDNIELVISGFGPEKKTCNKYVAQSKALADSVDFPEIKEWNEIVDVFGGCDVLINFANYSPGAGVILSAVASGMAVISTASVNASRHFMIDSFNGYFVYDEQSLSDAMEIYIKNPNILLQHRSRSRIIAEETLTFDHHIKDLYSCVKAEKND